RGRPGGGCHVVVRPVGPWGSSSTLGSVLRRVRTCVRMTAQGSAVTRLQRAIANPNTSAMQIRAIARELPTVGLEDALAIVLALLEREPGSFSRTGARWGARLVLERRLDLVDAQLVFASLATLEGP